MKDIKGYEQSYEVSEDGRVFSKERVVTKGGNYKQPVTRVELKQSLDSSGYPFVSLWRGGKRKRTRVHRLVAEAFIDNPEGKATVNHKNGVKSDNRMENLEWNTHGENKAHSFRVLGEKHWAKGKTGPESPYSKRVDKICPATGIVLDTYDSATIAAIESGSTQGNISMVCRGERKKAKGFCWRYTDG